MYSPGVNSSTTLSSSSYNNDRPPSAEAVEVATDPASGGFFNSDYKKYAFENYACQVCILIVFSRRFSPRHDDLKQMLDSNKDNLKLEAMKRIIGVCFVIKTDGFFLKIVSTSALNTSDYICKFPFGWIVPFF